MSNEVERFASRYSFPLDPFQLEALVALERGQSVLVAAPTGSGKTVVGEFVVWLALESGGKAFYTTPLKALSNQKFGDLIALHGASKVGLLTGDNSINSSAPAVVMTTEVLRNMIYERSDLLRDLRYVILDEVHYLQDRYRGAVWEEVIIHLPLDVRIVSLSATVSNAEEFAYWIQTLRGPTEAIIEERRPVELKQHYLSGDDLYPMFVTADGGAMPNPAVRRLEARKAGRVRLPRRSDIVEILESEEMLPGIYFIFSRKGCSAAVEQCVRDGLRLTRPEERSRIREYAEMRCAAIDSEDLAVLGYDEWLDALTAGFASHHAGMIPAFKETVEELFQAGLVKVVFATETLSLGINMPARSVVIESLTKFSGERHEVLTPGEFTQLTGRAGRRGIDSIGHAVIPRQRDVGFQQIAGLASTRTYPLVSSFQPSYNMATNLIRNYSREEADHLLNSSFAQYSADRDVVVLERLIERNEAYISSYREKAVCDRGDFSEYMRLKEELSTAERDLRDERVSRSRSRIRQVLTDAQPGQVFVIGTGRIRGPLVVVGVDRNKQGEPRVLAVNARRRVVRLGPRDLSRPPRAVARIPLSPREQVRTFSVKAVDHQLRRKLAGELLRMDLPVEAWDDETPRKDDDHKIEALRSWLEEHPCRSCPDIGRHEQWWDRAARLERENHGMRKRVRSRTGTLSRRFEKVLEVLEEIDYVREFALTDKGKLLARIYNENDLLVTEVLNQGWLSGLDPAEVASVVSTFVYESRGPVPISGTLPTVNSKRVYSRIVRLTQRLQRSENNRGLDMIRGTETGFVEPAYKWCRGATLEEVLEEHDLTPGDFIRNCKQTIDLIHQLQDVVDDEDLQRSLKRSVEGLNRGVVAYTGGI